MYMGSIISFATLLTFWMVISANMNLQHILVGILVSLFTAWFWKDLKTKLPGILSPKELLFFGGGILTLIGDVIKSNINVAKTLLFSDLSEGPMFLELEPGIESDWGKVLLSTCITITPGTVTIDYDPEADVFTVHALTRSTGEALYNWKIIDAIKQLERLVQRREAHVLDTARVHDSNSAGPLKGNYGAYRH